MYVSDELDVLWCALGTRAPEMQQREMRGLCVCASKQRGRSHCCTRGCSYCADWTLEIATSLFIFTIDDCFAKIP